MKELDIAYRTIFAELEQRSSDVILRSDFDMRGWFVTVPVKGREYIYFETQRDGVAKRSYVGPKDDPEIARHVAEFRILKDDLKGRRSLVSTLVRQGRLNAPERFTGRVVAALSETGLFRLRCILFGTIAYQNYAGPLGVGMASLATRTGCADFARPHSISAAIDDTIPPILDVLRAVDSSFHEVSRPSHGRLATTFENSSCFRAEFLTPNRMIDDDGRSATMPALGDASAQRPDLLDFLVRDPIRSVILHQSGIPVLIPAPERHAIYKLIVASRRRSDANGMARRAEDVLQASNLIEALILTRRQADLASAYAEARSNGRHWREALKAGFSYLGSGRAERLAKALEEGLAAIGEEAYGRARYEAAASRLFSIE